MTEKKIVTAINATLNAMGTNTAGICDICKMPVDQHPCAEHQQAVMVNQIEGVVVAQDEQWSEFLGVETIVPQPGRF